MSADATIHVHSTPASLERARLESAMVVVIDVLRATSTIAQALANGAASVRACTDIDAARVARENDRSLLLAGERDCLPIPGFDLGNSPLEPEPSLVSGRDLLLSTSNGTRAIEASARAAELVTAAFCNRAAVAAWAHATARDVHIVCAGRDGLPGADDLLCAGALVAALEPTHGSFAVSDSALAASWLWSTELEQPHALEARLATTSAGRHLTRVGYGADIAHVARLDWLAVVPRRTADGALRAD